MSLLELQKYYRQIMKEDDSAYSRAEKEAREEGFEDFSSDESPGVKKAKKIMEAIKRKDSYKDDLEADFEKATYPPSPRDTAAVATAIAQKEGYDDFSPGSAGAQARDTYAAAIEAEHGPGSYGKADWKDDQGKESAGKKKAVQSMIKGFPPALASLMSAAAGWAFSGDVGSAGQMTPDQAREWERTLSSAERRNLERSLRSKMRRKSADITLDKSAFEQLKEHFSDASDTYVQRKSIDNSLIIKEHSVIPPRQGLMWDAVKHRWTRPENVGHTVSEVQGKKRFRGVGTGAHERSVGGHGSGKARQVEAGRRFKGATDAGVLRPHSSKSGPSKKK